MNNRKFIIFGASGDLARKKLYPALFDLYLNNFHYDEYIGFGRKNFTDQEFRETVKTSVNGKKNGNCENFAQSFKYINGSYNEIGLKNLKNALAQQNENTFYLSIPISFELVANILKGLKKHGLIDEKTKIVLEKPFGTDYKTAKDLNNLVLKYLKEEQIYRIDHYLAKDLVRDLWTLRFFNSIFEPLWNNQYIEKIVIQIKELAGIENRGEFYENIGAIRDVIQNHALQLLALTVMREPSKFTSESIQKEKIRILKNLKLFGKTKDQNIEIGQHKGYHQEPHVKKDSLTETSALIKTEINLPAWKGVPIFLVTGKKLNEQSTDIIVSFKFPKNHPWKNHPECLESNELCFNIQPKNHIELKLNFGFDPQKKCTAPIILKFGFQDNQFIFKDAYENALKDLYNGDQSIFLSSEEILLSWKFIDSVIKLINKDREKLLRIY